MLTTTPTATTLKTTLLPVIIRTFPRTRPPITSFTRKTAENQRNKSKVQDVSSLLPKGYKLQKESDTTNNSSKLLEDLLSKIKIQDPLALLPPGYNTNNKQTPDLFPPDYPLKISDSSKQTTKSLPSENQDATASTTQKANNLDSLFGNGAPVDISAFLPKDYKPVVESPLSTTAATTTTKMLNLTKSPMPNASSHQEGKLH